MAWTNTEMTRFEHLLKRKNPHFERFFKSSLHSLIALLKTTNPTKDAVQQEMDKLPDKKDAKYKDALNYLRRKFPGLDEVVRGGLKLQGFAGIENEQARLSRAVLAVSRCHEVVLMCQKAVERVVGQSALSKNPSQWTAAETAATEAFKKWFDDKRSTPSVNRVRTVFANMEQALRGQTWEIVVYGTPEDPDPENLGPLIASAYAYVIPSERKYRIYLGSAFWLEGDARIDVGTTAHSNAPNPEAWRKEKKLKTALDAAVVTTVHELCHVRAISGTTDITDVQPNPYDWSVCKQNAKSNPNLALTNAENYAMFGSGLLMEKLFF